MILEVKVTNQLHTYSSPDRDPRQHTITTAFVCLLTGSPQEIKGMDDAAEAKWFDVENLPSPTVLEHDKIIQDFLDNDPKKILFIKEEPIWKKEN